MNREMSIMDRLTRDMNTLFTPSDKAEQAYNMQQLKHVRPILSVDDAVISEVRITPRAIHELRKSAYHRNRT